MALPSRGELARQAIEAAVETLARANVAYLAKHPNTPSFARAPIRYQRELRLEGAERWQTIPEILKLGYGDCEDLAAWVIAEARIKGIKAKPFVSGKRGKWHIRVKMKTRGGGIEIFDPSRDKGMGIKK
jgi:hypothetical protein